MLLRPINLPKTNSFFLFGARGTGKTSLLRSALPAAHYIDLLNPQEFDIFFRHPELLSERVASLGSGTQWVVLDEVQRVPELLNVVHLEIEAHSRSKIGIGSERPVDRTIAFAITGSSARKLKRGQANLLAGRAWLYNLFPLTFKEWGRPEKLQEMLEWGGLPGAILPEDLQARTEYLTTYVHSYLREEIAQEQIVRNLAPFRRFLEAAAQTNGQIVNFSKIAQDIGVTPVTVQNYFQILEDTLVALRLDPFHLSVRKRQRTNPKFYFFDLGIQRALSTTLHVPLAPQTYAFGRAFEHLVILEAHSLNSYARNDFRLSYLATKDGAEIDLVVERPGRPLALVEIKSSANVRAEDCRHLRALQKDMPNSEAFCLSLDRCARVVDGVKIYPWAEGLKEVGLGVNCPTLS